MDVQTDRCMDGQGRSDVQMDKGEVTIFCQPSSVDGTKKGQLWEYFFQNYAITISFYQNHEYKIYNSNIIKNNKYESNSTIPE